MTCCREKGIDGCYECEKLDCCSKGFYSPDNDGANACKAQAMYIRKYFEKTQEVLGTSAEEGLKILENFKNT